MSYCFNDPKKVVDRVFEEYLRIVENLKRMPLRRNLFMLSSDVRLSASLLWKMNHRFFRLIFIVSFLIRIKYRVSNKLITFITSSLMKRNLNEESFDWLRRILDLRSCNVCTHLIILCLHFVAFFNWC